MRSGGPLLAGGAWQWPQLEKSHGAAARAELELDCYWAGHFQTCTFWEVKRAFHYTHKKCYWAGHFQTFTFWELYWGFGNSTGVFHDTHKKCSLFGGGVQQLSSEHKGGQTLVAKMESW